jgi:hypothetical protein
MLVMVIFASNKIFELGGHRELEGNITDSRGEALSAVIPTMHGTSFSGHCIMYID